MGVTGKSSIIIASRKVISKHGMLKVVQDKANGLQKKVDAFKAKFNNMFKMSLATFWNENGQLISQEAYLELISAKRNEDSKFKEMKKPLSGHILIEKVNDDFNLLAQFEMIIESFPHFSYTQDNELEV